MMKSIALYLVVLNLVITTATVTTSNRILLSSVLTGAALTASVSGSYDFSFTELALLTTAVLVLNFPSNQQSEKEPCAAPGYTDHPLLGCYRLVKSNPLINYVQAKQACASDGGRLLLVNSEAEARALVQLMWREGVVPKLTIIQGSRTSVSSPWVGDDGNPLPYLPSTVLNQNVPMALAMSILSGSPSTFSYIGINPAAVAFPSYVCEI